MLPILALPLLTSSLRCSLLLLCFPQLTWFIILGPCNSASLLSMFPVAHLVYLCFSRSVISFALFRIMSSLQFSAATTSPVFGCHHQLSFWLRPPQATTTAQPPQQPHRSTEQAGAVRPPAKPRRRRRRKRKRQHASFLRRMALAEFHVF